MISCLSLLNAGVTGLRHEGLAYFGILINSVYHYVSCYYNEILGARLTLQKKIKKKLIKLEILKIQRHGAGISSALVWPPGRWCYIIQARSCPKAGSQTMSQESGAS